LSYTIGFAHRCRGGTSLRLAGVNSRYREIERQLWGYLRLEKTLRLLKQADIIPLTDDVAHQFNDLRKQKLKVGTQDLKIAAIALTHHAEVATANERDFGRVPELKTVNWIA
jgi:tRNA(fMet)-specific endonuclease VapC